MNPLQLRLLALRRRLRFQIAWRGLCALVGLVVGAAVLAGLADWFLELPSLIRSLALVSILGASGLVAYRTLIMPLATRCDDLALALQIEAHYPELNDALASTVQFLEETTESPLSGSPVMRKFAIKRTLALTEDCDFNKVLQGRGILWVTVGALIAVAAAGHFLYHHTQFAATALWRLGDPFGNHTWTRITVGDGAHRIAQGQPFVVKGQIAGIVPGSARLEIEGTLKSEKIVAVKGDPKNTHAGSFTQAIDMTQQKGKFRFRIYANDAVYPRRGQWHEVEVLPPPKFAMLNGLPSPQIELRFPEYTELPSPASLTPGTKHIEGIAGTHVTYRAAFDRPLERAWIEFRPENPVVRTAALLAPLGLSQPLAAAGTLELTQAVWGRVQAQLPTKQTIAMEFVPHVNGTYILHVEDDLGLSKDFEADLRVVPDPLPTVQLMRPASSMSVVPDAEIAFKMFVNDDIFAVRSVFVEYRKKDGDNNQWLDEGPRRLPLYDHAVMRHVLPQLGAGLARSGVTRPPLRLRAKNLEIATKWALQNQFKEGEVIVLQVCADDFCDIFPGRPAGRSHEIELRIVSKAEIARILDDGLGKAQQELVRLQQLQEEALNLIKDIQQKKAKGKLTQKELGALIDAEQLQKQMQERLGNRPDEGLRDELAKLQQLLKDNKLPGSEVADHIKTLKNELERLAQEDMQQIEPNLAEARKEMAGTTTPAPKDKGPLDKAQKLQEQTKKTLDELAKFLDPWASMHQVKGETRNVLNKQKDLKKDVEKVMDNTKKELLDNAKDPDGVRKVHEEFKGELDKKAEGQKELGDRAQKLLDMMDKAQAKRTADGDKDGAKKLQNAEKIGKNAMLPDKMRDAGKDLAKEDRLNSALQKQQENIKNLERMLAALDERKEDDIDRLQKKQKNAGEIKDNVDKLAKDQDKLQKKAKQAAEIADPEERAKELKKLAEEQDKLKDDAQKNARELARLQEEQAAKALNRAAQEMDKAAHKLEDGQNPEENQLEALDRVEDAQAKLEQFEEELAREQLAKIADRIKGLKERQDAALDRSKELHKKVLAKKKWSTGLVETLGADITTQQGLAGETRSLKEKIKEAKVFEHVFEKAAKAMDEAASAMDNRKEAGKERRFADFEPEELADENTKAQDVEKLQARASQRLQRLLDALKNDPPEVAQNDGAKKEPGEGAGDEGGQRMRPGDGIPPVAQLKALRSEQLEVNERTKEFAKLNPDPNNLNEAQRRELTEMEAEQGRLHRLFEEMTAPAEKKGDMP